MVLVPLGTGLGWQEATEVDQHGHHHLIVLRVPAVGQVAEVAAVGVVKEVAGVPAANHQLPGLEQHCELRAPISTAASRPLAVLAASVVFAAAIDLVAVVAAAAFGPRLCGCHVSILEVIEES